MRSAMGGFARRAAGRQGAPVAVSTAPGGAHPGRPQGYRAMAAETPLQAGGAGGGSNYRHFSSRLALSSRSLTVSETLRFIQKCGSGHTAVTKGPTEHLWLIWG